MLHRLALITTTLIITPFFFFAVSHNQHVYAAIEDTNTISEIDQKLAASGNNSLDQYLREFCQKRSGNQMNLETWYSGKCTADTFSGEGVGFSDIVLLDIAEKIIGRKDPNQTFSQILKDVFIKLKDIENTGSAPEKTQLEIKNFRQELAESNSNGLVGQMGGVISSLYKYQPASTITYLAYLNNNLQKHKITSPAIAADTSSQGIGFSSFSPFLPLWVIVRNLAYLVLVVFFVVYGFMMMFRVNISQNTVVTVQLAIPKLIITFLLITFSYAIVGLFYDLMYVIIYLAISYLESQKIILNGPTWHPAVTASGMGVAGIFGSFIINTLASIPASLFATVDLMAGVYGTVTALLATGLLGGSIGFVIIPLILSLAVLIAYGKLILKLITAFVSVVISLITAPLVLLGNAFPGSQAVGSWLRGVIANLSVFPITAIFLMLSYIFMIQPLLGICAGLDGNENSLANLFGDSDFSTCENVFGAKYLVPETNVGEAMSTGGVPLIKSSGFWGHDMLALIGLALLLMAAKYVDIVREKLKAPPFPYGNDLDKALKEGYSLAGKIPGVNSNRMYRGVGQVTGWGSGDAPRAESNRFPSAEAQFASRVQSERSSENRHLPLSGNGPSNPAP